LAALIAKGRGTKGKATVALKKSSTTLIKAGDPSQKKTIQHRHSFTSTNIIKKNSIQVTQNEKRSTLVIGGNKTTKSDNNIETGGKKPSIGGCVTPQNNQSG